MSAVLADDGKYDAASTSASAGKHRHTTSKGPTSKPSTAAAPPATAPPAKQDNASFGRVAGTATTLTNSAVTAIQKVGRASAPQGNLFKCQQCDQQYFQEEMLLRHIREEHKGAPLHPKTGDVSFELRGAKPSVEGQPPQKEVHKNPC
jgi:hypothetical protein